MNKTYPYCRNGSYKKICRLERKRKIKKWLKKIIRIVAPEKEYCECEIHYDVFYPDHDYTYCPQCGKEYHKN